MRRRLFALLVLGLAVSLAGCGYRLQGSGSFLPSEIRTIGIPPFESAVPRQEVSERLTAAVTREFVSRGRYRIEPTAQGTDAVLLGTITGFVVTPVAVDASGRQTRSVLTVTASVSLRQRKEDRLLFENPAFRFRAEVDLGDAESQSFDPEAEAIELISRDFARSLVATVVEGF